MKIKKGKNLKGANPYDVALADPFKFLSGLRGGEIAAQDFDPENMNKAAHAITAGNFDEQEIDIARTIREVVDSKILVPRDMKIDDSGIPVAKNVYEWCTNDRFAMTNGEKPYIEQLTWGIITFNEYCVAKGSTVFTDRGILKIEDFVGKPTSVGMQPMRARVATDSGSRFTSHGGLTSKRRKCLKVTYASGHSIIVTPDHRVQVLNEQLDQEWVRADKLRIGDYGVMPYGTNTWSKKNARLKDGFIQNSHASSKQFKPLTSVTSELARLTGYLISDGFMNKNTIGFINTDQNVIDDFVLCCEAVFGYTPKIEVGFKSSGKIQSTIPYTNVFLHGGNFVQWLQHIGFQGKDCYTKAIPDYIMTSTKDIVVDCLRSIFDCDGFVDRTRVGIELSSVECVRQISMLMQNLGVYGKFQEYSTKCSVVAHRELDDPKNCRALWVSNSPASVEAYAKLVGSIHTSKKANLTAPIISRKFVRCTKIAPVGVMPHTRALFKRASKLRSGYHDKGLTHTVFGRREFATFDSMLNDHRFVSFFESKNPAELIRIRKLAEANYSFAQVVKIEDAGYYEVYDLTVPSVENFVCNGVVVHNCPRCSDVEYLYVDHKVDDTYRKLERKVALLEHGVCPHCNWGRSKLIKKGKMKFIQELAVCAGQRSGKSLSIAGYFAPYHTHRLLKLQNPNAFYGLKTGTMLHCTFVALTYAQAKDTLWQNFYATLTESQWFCIAEGTSITLADGRTKPIEHIEVGDEVKTLEGTSTVDRHFDNGIQECFDVQLTDGKSVVGTAEHLVRCLSSDGNSLIWKKIGELTPDDYVVVE